MIDKKGMQLKSSFFAVLIFSMVVVASGIVISEWNDKYDANLDNDLSGFNKINDVSSSAQDQKEKLGTNNRDSDDNAEASTFRGVYAIITNIFAPFEVVFGEGGMIDSVTDRFGIPDYIRQTIITMIVVALTTLLIAVIFRLPRSNV